jgi:hypothetical protein
MTEKEWNACADPKAMLEFLRGKASDRKLRLFVCSCFSRINPKYTNRKICRAVEISERYADMLATEEERMSAEANARRESRMETERHHSARVALLGSTEKVLNPREAARMAAFIVAVDVFRTRIGTLPTWPLGNPDFKEAMRVEGATYQAPVLRCIFGPLPFRAITLEPAWLTSTVKQLAEAINEEKAFGRLPILADALEEAGYTNADMPNHCRQRGEHVRGCWVIDLLLGKC